MNTNARVTILARTTGKTGGGRPLRQSYAPCVANVEARVYPGRTTPLQAGDRVSYVASVMCLLRATHEVPKDSRVQVLTGPHAGTYDIQVREQHKRTTLLTLTETT